MQQWLFGRREFQLNVGINLYVHAAQYWFLFGFIKILFASRLIIVHHLGFTSLECKVNVYLISLSQFGPLHAKIYCSSY